MESISGKTPKRLQTPAQAASFARAVGFVSENLDGSFSFTLEWAPDPSHQPVETDESRPIDSNGPSIFTALQEQLGLRLQKAKAALDVLDRRHSKTFRKLNLLQPLCSGVLPVQADKVREVGLCYVTETDLPGSYLAVSPGQ